MASLASAFHHKPAFMPYFPLGYPTPKASLEVIAGLARGGADLIEVGLPFTDPLADGPVIQRATQTALRNGMSVARGLASVAELRRRGVTIPLVLMSYFNPLLAFGLAPLAREMEAAQADGLIVPDLPPEESAELEALLGGQPLIRMLAPTTPASRIRAITAGARGFLYLVSLTGVTGARNTLPPDLPRLIASVRQHTPLPLGVGFGISTPEQAGAVGRVADGVIVGSACVQAVGQAADPGRAAETWAYSFRQALRQSGAA